MLERRYFFLDIAQVSGGGGKGASRPLPCYAVTVAHQQRRQRARRGHAVPIAVTSLGFKSDSLADQFTLTGATWVDGLNGEPSGEEFCLVAVPKFICEDDGVGESVQESPALAILAR